MNSKNLGLLLYVSLSITALTACEFKGAKSATSSSSSATVAAAPATNPGNLGGSSGGSSGGCEGGCGETPPAPGEGISISNARSCFGVTPGPAVYPYGTFDLNGNMIFRPQQINWIVAAVSLSAIGDPIQSTSASIATALAASKKQVGQFQKTTFASGRSRFLDLEKRTFNLPVSNAVMAEMTAAARAIPDGTVYFAIYADVSGTNQPLGSNMFYVAPGASGLVRSTTSTAATYNFQIATTLITSKNSCSGNGEVEMCNNSCDSVQSPLVLDMEGDGVATTDLASGVQFDIDGDGKENKVAWLATSKEKQMDDLFLARDLNKNGLIDSGAELFGQATVLRNGSLPVNGFIALRELDSNGDQIFDSRDQAFDEILVWADRNGDGISQAQEISNAADAMKSVDLNFVATRDEDQNGNLILARSKFVTAAGVVRDVIDIFFKYVE